MTKDVCNFHRGRVNALDLLAREIVRCLPPEAEQAKLQLATVAIACAGAVESLKAARTKPKP